MKKIIKAIPIVIIVILGLLFAYANMVVTVAHIEPAAYSADYEENGESYHIILNFNDNNEVEECVTSVFSEYMSFTTYKIYGQEWLPLFGQFYLKPNNTLPIPMKVEDGVTPISGSLECQFSQYIDPKTGEWVDWEERKNSDFDFTFYFYDDKVSDGRLVYERLDDSAS